MSLSKLSTNSINGIWNFLSLENISQFSQVNKDFHKMYKQEQKKKELKLKNFIKEYFPTKLLDADIDAKSIYRIQDEKQNPINIMLINCINEDEYLQSKNYVTLIRYDKWVMRGYSYRIAYKYLSMGYRAELLYYHESKTFDVVLVGGSNGLDALSNEDKVRKIKKGKKKTIFEAFDIILDNNKLDKYLK
jgi:hypothetical protein